MQLYYVICHKMEIGLRRSMTASDLLYILYWVLNIRENRLKRIKDVNFKLRLSSCETKIIQIKKHLYTFLKAI